MGFITTDISLPTALSLFCLPKPVCRGRKVTKKGLSCKLTGPNACPARPAGGLSADRLPRAYPTRLSLGKEVTLFFTG